MTELTSSRFVGNRVLEEIRADPDTGTKKLKKGSDPTAVSLVQEAFYDLNWAQSFTGEDHYPTRARFVDGDYGPVTTRTAEVYKRHYRIVYPPGDPHGFIDGYTGPRTLERLDRQIAYRDRVLDIVVAKVGQLQEAGEPVRLHTIEGEPPPLAPWLGSGRSMRWWTTWIIGGEPETGVIVATDTEAYEVHGPIFRRWYELGGVTSSYGPPGSDVVTFPDDGSQAVLFEHGAMRALASGEVIEEPGPTAFVPPTGDTVIV